jgi:hypothetical protein
MGRFYCRTEKKCQLRSIFEEKQIQIYCKFKFPSVPVTQTSFDKRLND